MSTQTETVEPRASVSMINNPKVRGLFYQLLLLGFVIWLGYAFAMNAKANLEAAKIATGFGFLENTAGFGVNQSLIPYKEADTYGRVFVVGLLNTLLVAVLGIIFATLIGFLVGVGRLSSNWLLARLAGAYVEIIRNQPLLFQILFWYLAVLGAMPGPRQSIGIGLQPLFNVIASGFTWIGLAPVASLFTTLGGWVGSPEIYLNNRGVVVPEPVFNPGSSYVVAAFGIGVVVFWLLRRWAKKKQTATGVQTPLLWPGLGLIIGLPLVVLLVLGMPIRLDPPVLRGFNFASGVRLIPELVALLIALSVYTAAFIAEIVRAGIMAVAKGQTEASYSLGLRPGRTLNLVIIPQAMRVIIPPLTSQYLNLIKNSSLAVGIGYPDLFAVFAGTTLNQTGQAIEILAITMAVYLVISLITSAAMNFYNSRIALMER